MISFRSSMSVSLIALVAALAGCSGEAASSAGANVGNANAALAAPASAPQGHHAFGMHRHGGPDSLIHAALREPINLTAAQRATIEGLVKSNEPQKPAFNADHAAKLAAAIRNNTVESLSPQGPDTAARDARLAAEAAKLTTLHDTLTAEQRTQLVDAIAKRNAEHAQHRGEDGAKGGDHEHGRGERMRGEQGPAFGGPMHMLEGLDLTQAQKDAIQAKLEADRPARPTEEQRAAMKTQFEAMRAAHEAKLQTFKSNTFDAKAFVTPPQAVNGVMHGSEHRVNHLAVITSVLTPAQREILAKRIEAGPQMQPNVTPAPIVK